MDWKLDKLERRTGNVELIERMASVEATLKNVTDNGKELVTRTDNITRGLFALKEEIKDHINDITARMDNEIKSHNIRLLPLEGFYKAAKWVAGIAAAAFITGLVAQAANIKFGG